MPRINPCNLSLTKCNGLAIYTSADWLLSFRISERNNLQDTPVDLSNFTGRCNIKYSLQDQEPICQPSVDCDENGNVICSMPASMTKNIIVGGKTFDDILKLQYEILLTDNDSGETYVSLYGTVECVNSTFDSNDIQN